MLYLYSLLFTVWWQMQSHMSNDKFLAAGYNVLAIQSALGQ